MRRQQFGGQSEGRSKSKVAVGRDQWPIPIVHSQTKVLSSRPLPSRQVVCCFESIARLRILERLSVNFFGPLQSRLGSSRKGTPNGPTNRPAKAEQARQGNPIGNPIEDDPGSDPEDSPRSADGFGDRGHTGGPRSGGLRSGAVGMASGGRRTAHPSPTASTNQGHEGRALSKERPECISGSFSGHLNYFACVTLGGRQGGGGSHVQVTCRLTVLGRYMVWLKWRCW
jgi:hypothetical protein